MNIMFEPKHIALPASPVLRPTKRPHHLREALCILGGITILSQFLFTFQYFSTNLRQRSGSHGPVNSTLGFGGVYAVSRRGSPRRQSLLRAANLISLDILIPDQPTWTDEDITKIQAPVNSTVDRGSALAWLGHRNVIEKFLNTSDETALILEDDVDWDVRLRQGQIPQTAYAIRELLDSRDSGYYGDTTLWDIIWLGHCGDYFNASRGFNLTSIKSFQDTAMPNLQDLHPWTKDFMLGIGATQNQQRLVHQSVRPLCTFAYAITRRAAERVLHELTVSEPVRDTEHSCKAFDVRLLEGCRDEGLKCITVNPELFHHSTVASEIAQSSNEPASPANEETEHQAEKSTINIRCSARSRRWKQIQDSITDDSVDAESYVRELAERSPHCEIDNL